MSSWMKLLFIGYRYLNDSTLSSSQHDLFDRSPECRKTLNFLDDDEIRDLIMTKIHNIKSDVQVNMPYLNPTNLISVNQVLQNLLDHLQQLPVFEL